MRANWRRARVASARMPPKASVGGATLPATAGGKSSPESSAGLTELRSRGVMVNIVCQGGRLVKRQWQGRQGGRLASGNGKDGKAV